MAASLVGGAALGAAFGELLKAVLEIEHKNRNFEKTLAYIRTTLTAIQPLIREIEQQNRELGRPKEELESLIRDMEDGTKLVHKCSKICRCNFPARIHHQEQLAALVESLIRFFIIDMQAQNARDLKDTLITVRRIHSAINKISPIRTEEITVRTSCSNNSTPEILKEEATNQSTEDTPNLNYSYQKRSSEVYMEGAYDKKAPPGYVRNVIEETHHSMSVKKYEDESWTNNSSAQVQTMENADETESEEGDSSRAAADNLVETQSEELGGAIVRAAFGELLKAVMEMKGKAVMFKSTLSYLQTTIMAIDPLIKEMEHDYLLDDEPNEEVRLLIRQIADVTSLVYKCSRIHKLNYLARIRCQEQLLAMVQILVKFFIIDA